MFQIKLNILIETHVFERQQIVVKNCDQTAKNVNKFTKTSQTHIAFINFGQICTISELQPFILDNYNTKHHVKKVDLTEFLFISSSV